MSADANKKADLANSIAAGAPYLQDLNALNQALEDYRMALANLAKRANRISVQNSQQDQSFTAAPDAELGALLPQITPTAGEMNVSLSSVGPNLMENQPDTFSCASRVSQQANWLADLAAGKQGEQVSWNELSDAVSVEISKAPDGGNENNADSQFSIADKSIRQIEQAIGNIRLGKQPEVVECKNLTIK